MLETLEEEALSEFDATDVEVKGRTNNGNPVLAQSCATHSGQMKVFQSPHRFKVVCAGDAGENPGCRSPLLFVRRQRKKAKGLVCRSYLPDGSPDFVDDLQEVLPRKWVRKKNDTTIQSC